MKNIRFTPITLFILAVLIAVPALLINLGKQPMIDDEAIRALVAFEMMEKNDLITPTIAGELYLKKPPLYNWILVASFKLFGRYDEWAVRAPMILSLLLFTGLIYYFFRRETDNKIAILVALMFLTSGRILVYESLYGLIDITYSMLIFTFFLHIYRCFMRGNIVSLFISGYFIIALAFLMKGLPSIAFLGITLLVLFVINKKFKLLFHWGHILGVLVFILIVGGYYFLYFNRNAIAPREMLDVVLGESSRRTVVRFGVGQTVLHILKYPFEVLYHFLPWGLLVFTVFYRGSIDRIRKHSFLRYIALVFLANILIYWTSPEVFPRYILMLVPLMFGIFGYLYYRRQEEHPKTMVLAERFLGILVTLMAVATLGLFFIDLPISSLQKNIAAAGLFMFLGVIAVAYWINKPNRMLWLAIFLLMARIGFDFLVIPTRHAESPEIQSKETAIELAAMSADRDLHFWWNPDFPPESYYGYRICTYRFNYYLVLYRESVVPVTLEKDTERYYISKLGMVKDQDVEVLKTFRPPGQPSDLVLFRFLPGTTPQLNR